MRKKQPRPPKINNVSDAVLYFIAACSLVVGVGTVITMIGLYIFSHG